MVIITRGEFLNTRHTSRENHVSLSEQFCILVKKMVVNRVLLLRKSMYAFQWEVARDMPECKCATLDPMVVTVYFPFQRGLRKFLVKNGSE
jgi:hypothetical protein